MKIDYLFNIYQLILSTLLQSLEIDVSSWWGRKYSWLIIQIPKKWMMNVFSLLPSVLGNYHRINRRFYFPNCRCLYNHSVMLNFVYQLDYATGHRCLFNCYSRCFRKGILKMMLTFKSVDWLKQVTFYNVGGLDQISWRFSRKRLTFLGRRGNSNSRLALNLNSNSFLDVQPAGLPYRFWPCQDSTTVWANFLKEITPGPRPYISSWFCFSGEP